MTLALPTPPALDADAAPALRWGVVGTGIGSTFAESVHAHTPQRVVAISARDPHRTAAAARRLGIERSYTDTDALIDDPEVEAVYVATPHPQHAEVALRAIAAGKSVLIEKPTAMSATEAEAILSAARAAGVLAMEAMWTRYLPQSHIMRRVLADGLLGDIRLVRADFGFSMPYDRSTRWWDPALGGGALLDAGIYPVAFASEVLGAPLGIRAVGTVSPDGVDATADLLLTHPQPASAVLSTALVSVLPARAEIVGSTGRLDLASPFFAPSELTVTVGHWPRFEHASWRHPSPAEGLPGDGYAWEAVAFARYVAEGRLESPLHSHTEVVSVLGTIDETRRQIGAEGRPAWSQGEVAG